MGLRDELGTLSLLPISFPTLIDLQKRASRMLALHPNQAQYLALQAARLRQQAPDFKERYAKRAGIDGTLSQGVRGLDLRRSRYLGQPKTRLQHVFIAAALNVVRIGAWLMARSQAQTPLSRFGRLAHSPQLQATT